MKKLIAILLVLAALMGVCSAAFTDEKEITDTYAEAVNAMVEAKVISGFPDGTFQPKGTLTRAQAAKIITVLLEGDKAETVTAAAAGFVDVPAGNWAEKYVNYCAEKKIVAGVGSGKFNPNGELTGAAWAKMLLVAYGHDATELTGEKWFTNTQKAIREKGMNKNAFTSDAPTNREKACQLAFNFYHNTKVQNFETNVLAPAGYKETTFSLEGGKNVRLLGRAQATDKGIKTNFPADGMEFTLDCGGTLTLTISATDTANAYRTFIDGEAVSFAPTKSKEVVLTEMLQPGMHTIRVVQDKEINTSGKINTISAITVSAKGGEMKATAPAKYLIEFIGASTEAGCGTLGGVNDTWSSDYHSVTSSHTYKLGQLLGADVNVVAKGGIGLVAKSGKHATDGLYFFHNGYASDEVYKPTRKPDVIAINTPCSNDKGDYSSKEELLEKGRAFVKKLIEVNGTDVHYVFFGGHMVGKNPSASTQEISEVKKQLAKEFGFPFVTLPNGPNGVPAKAGGTPHPSAEDGTKQAEAFAEYLKTVLK